MATKDFSDTTTQTLTTSTKLLAQDNSTANKLANVTGQKILDFLQSQTYKTEAQILALLADLIPNYYIFGGDFSFDVDSIVTLNQILLAKDSTNAVDIGIASGFTKKLDFSWVAGDGEGGLDAGVVSRQRIYYIWAIRDDVNDLNDLLFSLSNSAPNMPVGYTYKRIVGACYRADNNVQKTYQHYDLTDNGSLKPQLLTGYKYFSRTLGFDASVNAVYFYSFKYNLANVDFIFSGNWTKLTSAFVVGDNNGMLDTGTVATDTQYYLYTIKNPNTGAIDFLMSLSSTSPTMPSGYIQKALIGFLHTFGVVTDFVCWTISEKWDDENFDVSSIAKSNSIETDAPSYEDLYSTGIKVACFNNGAINQISAGKEYAHRGKVGQPIQFHAHISPATTNVGTVNLFVDYFFMQKDSIVPASVTRIVKQFTTSGVVGKQDDIAFNFIPAICPKTGATLQQGTQIWFRFGRTGTTDSYTGKIAVRTFGYHFVSDKDGSDLITTNL